MWLFRNKINQQFVLGFFLCACVIDCAYIIVTNYYLRKNDVHNNWFSSYWSSGIKTKNECVVFIVLKKSCFKGFFYRTHGFWNKGEGYKKSSVSSSRITKQRYFNSSLKNVGWKKDARFIQTVGKHTAYWTRKNSIILRWIMYPPMTVHIPTKLKGFES